MTRAALLAWGALTAVGLAPAADPPAKEKERVILVLRTDASLRDARKLEELLEQAKEKIADAKLNVTWREVPPPTEVTKEIYDFVSDPNIVPDTGGSNVRIAAHTGSAWVIDIGGLGQVQKLEFKYPGERDKDDPDVIKGGDPRLTIHTVRSYKLAQLFKVQPTECTITVQDGKDNRVETQKWPVSPDRYWLVQLRDFEGEKDAFFKLLKKYQFGTPIRDVGMAKSTTFVVGDLRTGRTTEDIEWSGNSFIFRYSLQLAEDKALRAERVFVLFPLTQKQAADTAKRLNGMKSVDIMTEITEKSPRSLDGDKTPLNPEMEAKWIEVPKAVGLYQRAMPVENIEGWRKRMAAKKDDDAENYSVAVYELVRDDTTKPRRVADATHPLRPNEGAVSAIDMEIKQWPIGLKAPRLGVKKSDPPKEPKEPK